MRWIAHVDMDSFFVSVERLQNPSLNHRPVVVGGTGPRAVVASASYEARKFGVRSAMPMAQARRLCSSLVIAEPHFSEYSRLSQIVFNEMKLLAPVVEQVSIDEAYLDFTGCERIYRSREASGAAVREAVKRVSGLTCTVAVATNKLLAKVAADFAKPDGLIVVPAGTEAAFLKSMAIGKLPGVGPKTAAAFEAQGVKTCGDLAALTPEIVKRKFGLHALDFLAMAKGVDHREVEPDSERKSIGEEETFDKDIEDLVQLDAILLEMSENLGTNLRSQNLRARTLQIKIRYPDFTTFTRARTLSEPTSQSKELYVHARELLRQHKVAGVPLRLLGMSVRNLQDTAAPETQLNLFEATEPTKATRLDQLKDELKEKFGKDVLVPIARLKPKKT